MTMASLDSKKTEANKRSGIANKPGIATTPFEWLSGGLFFGSKKGGGIESIDSCEDVMLLLEGIRNDLHKILSASSSLTESSRTVVGDDQNSTKNNTNDNVAEEPSKFLAARLSRLRFLLYDERRLSSQQDQRKITPTVAGTTLSGLTGKRQDLMPCLLENLVRLPFESRKHVAAIFNYLLVCGLDGSDAVSYKSIMDGFLKFVDENYEVIMTSIVRGHDTSKNNGATDVSLHCGSMYRSCLRHLSLYEQLIGTTERASRFVFPFLDEYVLVRNFDASSDAIESLRLVMTAGGDTIHDEQIQMAMAEQAAEFLTRDYEQIWDDRFNPKLLLDSADYMTRRVALQILSTVLLTRSNYAVMIKYVANRKNLILVMHLLRDTSPHITLDAFHVFKVFVANPNKPPEIVKILQDNKVKLCRYLTTLHKEKEESDPQFRDEKVLIIATIEAL